MTNWKEYRLGDIARVKGGKRLPKGASLTTTPSRHPYIRVRDMGGKYLPINNLEYVPDEVFPDIKNYIVDKGDVILSIVGSVGLVSIVNEELDKASLTENCVKILPDTHIMNNEFLYYFLKSTIGQNEIEKKIVGAVQPKLPIYNINDIRLRLPELPIQKAIGEILSSIDDKIRLNIQIITNLESLAQAIFKHWFVDFEFPSKEGQPYKSNGGKMVDSDLGMIPNGWNITTLHELLEIKYGKDHKHLDDGNVPVYGSGGLMRYVNESLYDNHSILIPRKGTLSNLFYVSEPFWSVDTMFYSIIKEEYFRKYMFYVLKFLNLESMNVGSAVPSMTTKVLNEIRVIVPDKYLLVSFEELVQSMFKCKEETTKENINLSQLRDSILPRLISGKLEVI